MYRVTVVIIGCVLFCLQVPVAEGFKNSHRIVTANSMVANKRRNYLKTIVMNANDALVEPGIGDEGCKLPAPSKVNTLPIPAQAGTFVGIFVGLYFSTMALVTGVESLKELAPGIMLPWMTTWPLLGAIFAAAGVAHFTLADAFRNMYPAQGAWGLWYVPFSASFHVAWTGVAELVFGSWMVIGALTKFVGVTVLPTFLPHGTPVSEAALALLVLTILVTPANIYMYTHGAKLLGSPEIPVSGHAIRGFMQALLLCLFYEMALPVIS